MGEGVRGRQVLHHVGASPPECCLVVRTSPAHTLPCVSTHTPCQLAAWHHRLPPPSGAADRAPSPNPMQPTATCQLEVSLEIIGEGRLRIEELELDLAEAKRIFRAQLEAALQR